MCRYLKYIIAYEYASRYSRYYDQAACEYSLRSGDKIEWTKDEGGARYRLQTLVHRQYDKQE
jgi:hypothetical protein